MSAIGRACAAVLVAGLAAGAWGSRGVDAQGARAIKIGVPLAATGADAREGALTLEGYEFWADTVNAHGGIGVGGVTYKVRLIYYDDQSKPELSAKLTDRLISQDHVNFLLGPFGTPATFADAVIAEKYKIPMVDTNGAARKIFQQGYRYVFGVLSPADDYAVVLLELATSLDPKPKTIALLSAGDLFSLAVAASARKWAEQHGLRVVYLHEYSVDVKDYSAAMNDLSAAVTRIKSLHPDVLFGSGHLQDSLLIMHEMQSLDADVKFYAFTVGPATPDFVKSLGPAANYVFAPSQWMPDVKYRGPVFGTAGQFAGAFKKKYGFTPDYHPAESAAGGLALQFAVEKAGSLDPREVRAALASLDVMTFFGPIRFDKQGLNIYKPMVDIQVQHGTPVTVWPAGIATGRAVYPTPPWDSRP